MNRKGTTPTLNIHKSLLIKNNRWRVILDKPTLITDSKKYYNLRNYVKKHVLRLSLPVEAFSSATGCNYDSNSKHENLTSARYSNLISHIWRRVKQCYQLSHNSRIECRRCGGGLLLKSTLIPFAPREYDGTLESAVKRKIAQE